MEENITYPNKKVVCIKDYVNGRLRIRKGSYWKLTEYVESSEYAYGYPRYFVQHLKFPAVYFNMSNKECKEKHNVMCFDDYFKICED